MFFNGLPCNLSLPSCLGVPKDSGSEELLPANMGNREPVILNVYDMVSMKDKWNKIEYSHPSKRYKIKDGLNQ